MSLSEATLEKVRKAKEHLKIHVHVAESEMDQFDAISRYRERVVKRLDRHKLLDEGALLVHCLVRLRRRAAVNPQFRRDGRLQSRLELEQRRRHSQPQSDERLGHSDRRRATTAWGPASTSDLKSLVFLSHYLKASATAFSLADLKTLLIESYRLASNTFEIPIGRLAEGFAADFQIIPYQPFTPLDETNVLGHLFYGLFDNWRPEVRLRRREAGFAKVPIDANHPNRTRLRLAFGRTALGAFEGGFLVNLTTTFDGLRLDNPLMPASGPLVGDAEKLLWLQDAGVRRARHEDDLGETPGAFRKPCIYGDRDYVMNSELWSEHPYQTWVDDFLPRLVQAKTRTVRSSSRSGIRKKTWNY
ncbi:MAG: hypothetical protein MZU97_20665 [Bacillus subtilis]|nr:hypothetical protein [Bacillus subtilis]